MKKNCAIIWVAITHCFMKKKWSAKEKSQIVLEGIKGRPVVDICATYGASQSLYYAWRENLKLKQSLAETILELKKSKRVGKW